MKKIAFLIDPIEKLKPHKDTSIHLMRGALLAGHKVYAFESKDLYLLSNKAYAEVYPILNDKFERNEATSTDLSTMDQIWVRIDPPVNQNYLYCTMALDFVGENTLVVNKPSALRDWNEKLAALLFPEYTPDTIMSQNKDSLIAFIEKHPRVTLKPIDGFGGRGILFTDKDDPNKLEKLESITKSYEQKIVAQRYIEEASKGDLRVLIWKDQVMGGILRVHADGKEINNLDAGGKAVKAELSQKQMQIAQAVAKKLYTGGVYFSGIDFLGDYLTEVNITSPTGLKELCDFTDTAWNEEIFKN
jgi:glutathione synthase